MKQIDLHVSNNFIWTNFHTFTTRLAVLLHVLLSGSSLLRKVGYAFIRSPLDFPHIHQTGHDMSTCLSFHTRLSPHKEATAGKKEFPCLILALKYRFHKNHLL